MNPFMEQALQEAYNGIRNKDGGPFGSVVVKDNKIVGRGHNCVIKHKDPTDHGEMMAIHDACHNLDTFDLTGCELYTTSAPCPMCAAAIMWANIERVYFGCTIEDAANIGFRDSDFYDALKGEGKAFDYVEMDRKDCQRLFEEYSNSEKTMY